MTNRNMIIASGIIVATAATAAVVGIAVKSRQKPKPKLRRNTARTLNTIGAVSHGLATMIY